MSDAPSNRDSHEAERERDAMEQLNAVLARIDKARHVPVTLAQFRSIWDADVTAAERAMLSARLGLFGQPVTSGTTMAQMMGRTEARVSQITRRALGKFRVNNTQEESR